MPAPHPLDKLAAMVVLLTQGRPVARPALNQLLWFADIAHLLRHGRTISGTAYGKWAGGPVPRDIDIARRILILRNYLKEHITETYCCRHYAYQSLPQNLDTSSVRRALAPSELKAIASVAHHLRPRHTAELIALSHASATWRATRPGDDLDLAQTQDDRPLQDSLRTHKLLH